MRLPIYHQRPLFDTEWRLFVVHMHAASRLHYDFRLEYAHSLKSWVLPYGLCLDPTRRRRAVLVNDHPIACVESEGTIPAGRYGAGTIMLWDRGIWRTDQDMAQALRGGRLKFELRGNKLKGIWSLIRESYGFGAKQDWHLRKESDREAKPLSETDILVAKPLSVVTNRTLVEIASEPPLFIPAKSKRNSKSKKPAPNQLPLFPDDLEP